MFAIRAPAQTTHVITIFIFAIMTRMVVAIVRAISSILRLNINYRKQRPARHTAKSHHLSFASWGKLRSIAALCMYCIVLHQRGIVYIAQYCIRGHCVYCIKRRQCVYCIRGTCRGPGSLLPSSGGSLPSILLDT